MTPLTPKHTLNCADSAQYIGLGVWWLKQARRKGVGPAYLRINRSIRYRVEDLDAWLKAHRVKTRESA